VRREGDTRLGMRCTLDTSEVRGSTLVHETCGASWILLGVLSLGVGGTSAGAATRHELKEPFRAAISQCPAVVPAQRPTARVAPSPFVARKLPTTTHPGFEFHFHGRSPSWGPAGWTCERSWLCRWWPAPRRLPTGQPDYSTWLHRKGLNYRDPSGLHRSRSRRGPGLPLLPRLGCGAGGSRKVVTDARRRRRRGPSN